MAKRKSSGGESSSGRGAKRKSSGGESSSGRGAKRKSSGGESSSGRGSISELQKPKSRLLPIDPAARQISPDTDTDTDIDEEQHLIDLAKMKCTHFPRRRHTAETRTRELAELGVVFSTGKYNFNQTEEEAQEYARSKTAAAVCDMVVKTIKLPIQFILQLMTVNRMVYNTLISRIPIWQTLDMREMNKAGDRLVAALLTGRYLNIEHLNLAYAKDIEDKDLKLLTTKGAFTYSLDNLESLNLDGCQNISNTGVKHITSVCPRLKKFSINGNSRVTDFCIKSLVKNCKCLIDLSLKGCKKLTDKSLVTIGENCHLLESLDIARCEQVTDFGVINIAGGCPGLKFLSLFEIPGVTDRCRQTLFKPSTRIIFDISQVDPLQF